MASEKDYGDVIAVIKSAIIDVNSAIDLAGTKLGKITVGEGTSTDLIACLQQSRWTLQNVHKELVYAREVAYPRA